MHLRSASLATLTLTAATLACAMQALSQQTTQQQYKQTNLVANATTTATATTIDPNLVGAWGLSESSTSPWWVSDQNSGLSTLYTGAGVTEGLVVTIPTADPNKSKTGSPTGILFNGSTTDFLLSDGTAASFIFATLDGQIVGWNGGVTANTGEVAVNESANSIFTGIAVAQAKVNGTTATYLYAANFKRGTIEVFDNKFNRVPQIENAIASIPMPPGFAPFNVQNIGGNLYVTLAVQDKKKDANQVNGPGQGVVGAITPEGKLIGVLETGDFLNAPWGIAIAPSDFGQYSHDLLVGNNGNGVIDVFNPVTGQFIARLHDSTGAVIKINGLWGLSFGSGTATGGPSTSLFFAAQPSTGGGLFGALTPVQNTYGSDN